MFLKTSIDEIPDELIIPVRRLEFLVRSYLASLSFIARDTARDVRYWDNNLLSYLIHDFIQSTLAIVTLGTEGMLNVAKREVRFIVEASIKLCLVQQKDYTSTIAEKLQRFDKALASQRISIKNNLTLTLLPEDLRDSFGDEVGRVYGLTSSYVHLTPSQIVERIAAVDAGRIGGKENAQDFEALISLVERGLAVSLVLLFHSVPEYVAGDWLVESDGTTTTWVFVESQFIAGIDSYFDYKHERQDKLDAVRATRSERSRF
ncbi:hypothetical protein [Gluconobacter oxydans]|uniref:Uncharacterized protein n=1 Tax=Gluconobacter oxydans TaxID=442 RepID=A0A149RUX3_GLUOY|nr:hypothetical protein [Gluconobacter oxydans]KXV18161.1 hypothetical protein AD934_09520 [Gluconobacter oxydans]